MAYGKRSKIKDGLENYNIMLAGEGGIGKTTLISEVCEKEFGSDGYLLLNIGDEDGVDCIEDVTYEDVPDYKAFEKICYDIIDNKEKDYPNLKVVVIDTVDQILNITEKYVIQNWNVEHQGEQNFKSAKTINPVEGGFGNGMDRVFEDVYCLMRELKKVGVRPWYICHIKTKDKVDALSNDSYTILTANMAQRYFEAFKTKVHIVGMACIDRTIVKKDTNRKDIMKKGQMVKINKVKESKRKIKFRDDNYSVDSKSRFAGIVDEIPMDADEFIKALKDAINSSKKAKKDKREIEDNIPVEQEDEPNENTEILESDDDLEINVEIDAETETNEDIEQDEDDTVFDDVEDDLDEITYPDNIKREIRAFFKTTEDKTKNDIKSKLVNGRLNETDISVLREIYDTYIRK